MLEIIEKAKKIRCLICDVDGVLTDGRIYLDNFGNEQKAFHVQDGMGLKMLMSAGIQVAVITTATAALVDLRMKQLGIQHYYKGQVEKLTAYETLKSQLQLSDSEFAYIGDDLPDAPILQRVGLGIAVSNAVSGVKEFAIWCTKNEGGNGAVREACDLILSAQNKTEIALQGYFAK